jgi:ABC-type multidrug transport system fused ATPase/permease subunit
MKKDLSNFLYILGKKNIKLSFIVLLGTVLSAILEMASIGSIIPVFTLIFSGEIKELGFLNSYIADYSEEQLYTFLILAVLSIFIFKTLYQAIFFYFLGLYSSKVYFDVSTNLYMRYLSRDYFTHIQENTANKVQLVNNESNMSVQGYLKPLMSILTEIFTVIAISILLLIYDYKSFLVLSFFLLIIFLLAVFSTRKILTDIGNQRTDLEIQKLKDIQQSFLGFKFVKLSNSFDYVANLFKNSNSKVASIRAKEFFLKQTVRPVLELSVIFSICLMSFYLYDSGMGRNDILILLSLYLTSAIRLLPSMNRIIGGVQSMNFFSNVIDRLFNAYQEEKIVTKENKDFKKKTNKLSYISFEDVTFGFPSSKDYLFQDINLNFDKFSFIGLIGESGSGKSTFLNMLIGLIEPNSGNVFNQEDNIFALKDKWYSKIGYVPQDVYLIDDTIRKNIAFGIESKEINEEKVFKAAKKSNLLSFINQQEFGLDTMIGENATKISGGQKQRLAIARALYNDPEILVFDEATSALDQDTEKEIIKEILLLRKHKTIFFSSHKPDSLTGVDRIIEFKNKSIIDIKNK